MRGNLQTTPSTVSSSNSFKPTLNFFELSQSYKPRNKARALGQKEKPLCTSQVQVSPFHSQLTPAVCGNNNYYLKRLYFCINLKGHIFFFPLSLCGLTYPKYLHKSPVTVNMYSTIQSSISYQVKVKTQGEMSA